MVGFSKETFRLIGQLLHDASVLDVTWNPALATLAIRFDCLRSSTDGSELNDRSVEFNLTDIQAVAIAYESASPEVRPSQFELTRRITPDELTDWPYRTQEAGLWIDSEMAEEALESARLDWMVGDEPMLIKSPHTFCLAFDQWADFGMPIIQVRILVGGGTFTITSGGIPLDIDDWSNQYAAWWAAWKKHWDSKKSNSTETPVDFDTAIPAGESKPPDLTYRPPTEPPFALEPTDCHPGLLAPIQTFLESHHELDWMRMARVYPSRDETLEDRAEQLRAWKSGHDFGRWWYARSIDQWWQEGRRASVTVRGIEHEMPSEGKSHENREFVWTFRLRQPIGEWMIQGYSQGWPSFRSAKAIPVEKKPWLATGSLVQFCDSSS